MTPQTDKLYRLHRSTLTPEQLHQNADALHALADGKRVEYFSPVIRAWCECWCVDSMFEHRLKPPDDDPAPPTEKPAVSTDINDY